MKLNMGIVLTLIILSGLIVCDSSKVIAQSGLVVAIDSDIIWTKADSPHELTGPLFISQGATLTIEAGATVNLNDYDILVNGTLRAISNSNQKININSAGKSGYEKIEFTPYSNGWDEQTGSGSIFENVIANEVDIDSIVPIKVGNSAIHGLYTSNSSTILSNKISWLSIIGGSPLVKQNDINTIRIESGSPKIVSNTIEQVDNSDQGYADSPLILFNKIRSIGSCRAKYQDIGVTITYLKANSPTIANNIVERGIFVEANSAVVANNTVTSYSFEQYVVTGNYQVSLKNTSSSGIILHGSGSISGNKISGCKVAIEGGTEIEGNWLTNSSVGIIVTQKDVAIRNNNITLQTTGIEALTGGKITVENNFIKDCDNHGIDTITSGAIILNNTFTDIGRVAIRLLNSSSATINYNNIQYYTQYSIYLDGTASTIDAANNYWGTTDTQAIEATIYDFKHDFYLGKVNIDPILTEPNPDAEPEYALPIPEFSSLLILPLLLGAAVVVGVYKRKISKQISSSTSC